MKNKFKISIVFFLFAIIAFESCEYDKIPQPVAPKSVSFNKDVMPIFSSSCSTSGCHSAGANQPDLSSTEIAFQSLTSLGYVTDSVVLKNNSLYQEINSKDMPPTLLSPSIFEQDTAIIYTWIRKGFRDN